jgi:hypothetical protein
MGEKTTADVWNEQIASPSATPARPVPLSAAAGGRGQNISPAGMSGRPVPTEAIWAAQDDFPAAIRARPMVLSATARDREDAAEEYDLRELGRYMGVDVSAADWRTALFDRIQSQVDAAYRKDSLAFRQQVMRQDTISIGDLAVLLGVPVSDYYWAAYVKGILWQLSPRSDFAEKKLAVDELLERTPDDTLTLTFASPQLPALEALSAPKGWVEFRMGAPVEIDLASLGLRR